MSKDKALEQQLQFEETRQLLIDISESMDKVGTSIEQLPATIKDALVIQNSLTITEDIKLREGSTVEVLKLGDLSDLLTEVKDELVKANERTDAVTLSNPDDIKLVYDNELVIKAVKELAEKVELFATTQPDIVVKTRENIIEFPKHPKDAIPVVLVDKELKKFYNALEVLGGIITRGSGSGGGGGFEIVGLKNLAGTTINPATEDTLLLLLAKIDVHVSNELPSGIKNGINTVFTTVYNYKANTLRVFLNGLRQVQPQDYTETGTNTLTLAVAPIVSDTIVVDYVKQ